MNTLATVADWLNYTAITTAYSFGFLRSLVCSKNFSCYQNSTEAFDGIYSCGWHTLLENNIYLWASNRIVEDKPDTVTQGDSFTLLQTKLSCRLRLKWSPNHQTKKTNQEPNGEGLQAVHWSQLWFVSSSDNTTHQCNCSREEGTGQRFCEKLTRASASLWSTATNLNCATNGMKNKEL